MGPAAEVFRKSWSKGSSFFGRGVQMLQPSLSPGLGFRRACRGVSASVPARLARFWSPIRSLIRSTVTFQLRGAIIECLQQQLCLRRDVIDPCRQCIEVYIGIGRQNRTGPRRGRPYRIREQFPDGFLRAGLRLMIFHVAVRFSRANRT